MIKAEFGIIDDFDANNDYTEYVPEKYNCVAIDDDLYINDWWNALKTIDTFNVYDKGVLQLQRGLSRWGTTIIPPKSLDSLYSIVVADKSFGSDQQLEEFAELIKLAISLNKHMIHYGV